MKTQKTQGSKKRSRESFSFQKESGIKNFEKTKIKKMSEEEKEKIKEYIEDLIGTKGALIFDENLKIIKKIPLSRLSSVKLDKKPYIIAINSTATQKIVEICEKLGCSNLIAPNFVPLETRMNLVSL